MHRNQTIGSILFGKWGDPTGADIRLIDNWEQVTTLNDSKQYTFLVKSGTVFTDIKMFFAELSAALLKTGIGHIDYDSKTHSVCLNDQALLTSTDMIPKTFNKTIKMKFPNFTRADKDIHHDYTPIYLRAGKGDYIIEKSKFGQDVIANHLNKHRYFNNFPPVLRQYKVYLPNPSVQDPFVGYKDMIENTLWIFNNEKLKIKNSTKVLCTGGGIGWMLQTAKKIHICDISKLQLKFIDQCIKQWNGINFGEFVYRFLIENKVRHWHLNLDEKQDSNKELIRDEDKFIDAVNQNFDKLVDKYRNHTWAWQDLLDKEIVLENKNILDCVKGYHIDSINLSNILDFKYNYITDNIDKWINLISPATKSFVKTNTKQNPYKDPPCEKLELNVPVEKIHKEIIAIKKYLVPHREESGMGWSSFCIHGKSYDATKEDTFYNDLRPHNWTKEALENMPQTIAWLRTLGYTQFQRVRVMCLAPKGFINIHRDATQSKLTAVNVAITHPTTCKFFLEHHGELQFSPGVAYRLNLVNYHAVINYSNQYRYHIIIHGDNNDVNRLQR
tara:strand:+ start:118 stop:1785 length:1668 start_codon:yes stop_codon:yes gene_type:complete